MANAPAKGWKDGPRKPLGIFGSRSVIPPMLNWRGVSSLALRAALSAALAEGATLSFAPASGGTGVTLRVYQGDGSDSAFCGDEKQLTELLVLITEKFASGSEDIWKSMAVQGEKGVRPE